MTDLGGELGRAHAVQAITVTVERTESGRLRVTSPSLPGWQRVAASPVEVGAIVAREVFAEAEIASYARFRGSVYDAALLEVDRIPSQADTRHPAEPAPSAPVVPSYADGAPFRPDQHDPADWTPLPDGRWLSPGGRRFREDTPLVASVIAKRQAAGLPVSA